MDSFSVSSVVEVILLRDETDGAGTELMRNPENLSTVRQKGASQKIPNWNKDTSVEQSSFLVT